MQDLKRDNLGFIDLEELGCTYQNGTVIINGETYFYKDSALGAYKELVVDELAKDFGIKCAFYDLASFSNHCGLISRDLNGEGIFIPMYDELSKFYHITDYRTLKQFNNLDDLGIMLEQKFDHGTFQKLINQLHEIYLFDILVGNPDRNVTNYGLLYQNGSVDVVIFDNELSMDSDVTFEDKFQIKGGRNRDGLSDLSFDVVQDRIQLISNEHIDEVIDRVEQKIHSTINEGIKCHIKSFFVGSRTIISKKIPKQDVK